jgi:hypothetical protein
MTLDNGWAMIISSVLTVFLIWIGNIAVKHFTDTQGKATSTDEAVSKLYQEFLKFQTHVAEHYVKAASVENIRRDIFGVIARLESKVDRLLEKDSTHD